MISPADLKYFIETAKELHVGRAAIRLGISQPALSQSLMRTEREVKTKLFERTRKGVHLTATGKKFFEACEKLNLEWVNLVAEVQNEETLPQGLIRLGCHTAVAQYTLPKFLPEFVRDFPNIKIKLQHALSRHIMEQVVGDELDVGLVVNPPQHPDVVIRQLCQDTVRIWTHKKNLNPDLLIYDAELRQSQWLLEQLGRHKKSFKREINSSSLEVIAQLLASGTGCAVLPERVVGTLEGKGIVPLKDSPEFSDRLCLVFKPSFKKLARGAAFIDAIKKIT